MHPSTTRTVSSSIRTVPAEILRRLLFAIGIPSFPASALGQKKCIPAFPGMHLSRYD